MPDVTYHFDSFEEVVWVSPTGYEATLWVNPYNAYDDDTDSGAVSGDIDSTLVLTHAALTCGRIRFLHSPVGDPEDIKIRVYKDGEWEIVFDGSAAIGWQTVNFVQGSVTKAEISFTAGSSKYFYEFDFGESGAGIWTDPDNIVDNNLETFGYTNVNGQAQALNGNDCPGTNLGIITKVELRQFAKGDGDDKIVITSLFTVGDGDPHDTVPVVSPGDWTPYVDITNDTNHPDWSLWSHIQTLDCKLAFAGVGKKNTVYASKVEIRVTYTLPVAPTVTTQAVSSKGSTTARGNGNITATGGQNCSKRGVCWNTTGSPTVADSKSEETDSFGTGAFSRWMTGLTPGEHYYVKAYAYNPQGYGYGGEVEFDAWTPPVSDIDIGADPIDRTSARQGGWTYIDKNNPANASGTLHSIKIWARTNITGLRVGTFYTTNGDTLKCRDSVVIGDVPVGLQEFTELSIAVETGDYIGFYWDSFFEDIEADMSGLAGVWYVLGEYIDPNDETAYDSLAGYAISLYGYGDIEAPPGQPYISRVQRIAGMKTIGVNL